ncbi:sulfatase-like hydrolase/transferase [Erysipelothrix sp. HDW6A]|uniref:LTA synthase family protein n=1 Tax=Erysipelothrix sp. HDW6A TaxID=2714928 RepID=UPI00140C09A1|nr:alkaline phosphatase family protein [Erysipelothrix sp. HDW6A]QIK57514.1 sulfatase-like hydrolase/transferase [Erysipelothrix sp. HDW6A]
MEKSVNNKKQTIKYIIGHFFRYTSVVLIGLLISGFSLFLLNMSTAEFNFPLVEQMYERSTPAHLFSVILIFISYVLITIITNNILYTSVGYLIVTVVLAVANTIKISILNEPIYPSDAVFIKNINLLFKMVSGNNLKAIIIGISVISVTIIITWFINRKFPVFYVFRRKRLRTVSLVVSTILIGFWGYFVSSYNRPDSMLNKLTIAYDLYPDLETVHQIRNYFGYGFYNGLIVNAPGQNITKPIGYSSDAVHVILDKYQDKADTINLERIRDDFEDINVFTILSESLSDPSLLNGLDIDSPFTYITDKTDKVASGYVLTPVYGGGTPNTEYELLTSMSIGSLNSSVATAFQSFVAGKHHLPSLFRIGENEREALALHSYGSHLYKRKQVYSALGVDTQIFSNDMNHTEPITPQGELISDESTYQEVLDIYSETDEAMTLHIVTMQNHQSYYDIYPEYHFIPNSTSITNQETLDSIKIYTEGLYYTDLATQDFVDSLNQIDKPYILFLYGDHLSGLYNEILSENDHIMKYTTNYFIVSNIPGVETSLINDEYISLSNVQNILMDLASVKISAYQALVMEVNNVFASVHRTGYYLHGDPIPYTFEELSPDHQALIHEYDLIQYDLIDGNNYSVPYLYYE